MTASSRRRSGIRSAGAVLLILILLFSALPCALAAETENPKKSEIVSIPEDALTAPVPDYDCYGALPLDEADKVNDLIRRARDSGLLGEDEVMAFDSGANFYRGLYGRNIEYYLDDSILVILWKENIEGKCCTFAEVKIADPSQFRRKLADDTYGSQYEYFASEMAEQVHSVVAMNADFYKPREFGIVIWNRELCRFNTDPYVAGYIKYNCVDTLFVNSSGDFLYKRMGEENTPESIEDFVRENDILFSVAFGPVLVENGEPLVCDWYPLGEVNQGYSRAGIGQMGKLHYLYMSLNHGSQEARWTVTQFAQHFAEKPVQTAYCLDGGQTGEVYFCGSVYNYIDFGVERRVSDILYFATAIPSAPEEAEAAE